MRKPQTLYSLTVWVIASDESRARRLKAAILHGTSPQREQSSYVHIELLTAEMFSRQISGLSAHGTHSAYSLQPAIVNLQAPLQFITFLVKGGFPFLYQ